MAECLAGLAGLAEDPRVAARLFGTAEAMLERVGAQIWHTNRADHARAVAAQRARLDGRHFAEAWRHGREMAVDDAISTAFGSFGSALDERTSRP